MKGSEEHNNAPDIVAKTPLEDKSVNSNVVSVVTDRGDKASVEKHSKKVGIGVEADNVCGRSVASNEDHEVVK